MKHDPLTNKWTHGWKDTFHLTLLLAMTFVVIAAGVYGFGQLLKALGCE